jgi:molybdopterin-binding protein
VSQPDGASPTVAARLDCGGATLIARITRKSLDRLDLVPGRVVHAVIKSVSLDLGGRRAPGGAATGQGTPLSRGDVKSAGGPNLEQPQVERERLGAEHGDP